MSEADRCTICRKPFAGADDKIFCLNCKEHFCPRCFGEIENGQCKYCKAGQEAVRELYGDFEMPFVDTPCCDDDDLEGVQNIFVDDDDGEF